MGGVLPASPHLVSSSSIGVRLNLCMFIGFVFCSEVLFSRCAMSSQAKSLTLVRTTWAALGDGATARQYTAAISFLGQQKLWQHACEVFCAMPRAQVNTISYNAVITACKKGSKWQLAINFFEQVLLQCKSDVISYSAAMMSCVEALQWQAALKLFHSMPAANVIAYSSAITCCEKSAQWQRALAIFETMKEKTVTPSVVTFNAVISSCKDSQRASRLFLEMSSLKIEPDIVSYTSWINSCQHWQHALKVFSSMARLQPNLISFNSLLSSCEKASRWQVAQRLWEDMQRSKLRPDLVSYNSMISAFEKASEWQKAVDVFGALSKPDLFSYNALLSACEKAAQWQRAQHIFFSLKKPDLISYSALTSAFEKAVRWQSALELFQRRRTKEEQRKRLSSESVQSILRYLRRYTRELQERNLFLRRALIQDVASNVLLVVATASSILPLILRVLVQIYMKDESEDPTAGISSCDGRFVPHSSSFEVYFQYGLAYSLRVSCMQVCFTHVSLRHQGIRVLPPWPACGWWRNPIPRHLYNHHREAGSGRDLIE